MNIQRYVYEYIYILSHSVTSNLKSYRTYHMNCKRIYRWYTISCSCILTCTCNIPQIYVTKHAKHMISHQYIVIGTIQKIAGEWMLIPQDVVTRQLSLLIQPHRTSIRRHGSTRMVNTLKLAASSGARWCPSPVVNDEYHLEKPPCSTRWYIYS